jgi:hypothetical protein
MSVFYPKRQSVTAMRFMSNNEPGDKNMNAICIAINQGRQPEGEHCWHNGTDIFVTRPGEGTLRASVGEWLVAGEKNIEIWTDTDFDAAYAPAPIDRFTTATDL